MDAIFEQPPIILGGAALAILVLVTFLLQSLSSSSTVAEKEIAQKAAPKAKSKKRKAKKKTESVPRKLPNPLSPKEKEPSVQVDPESAGKKKKKKKNKKKKPETTKTVTIPEPSLEEDNEEDIEDDDDDDVTRLLNKSQLAKTQGKPMEKKKKKKKGADEEDKTWVMVNKGDKSSSSAAEASSVDDNTVRTVTLRFDVEDKPVLLGPKGATIQAIQEQSGARLDIDLPVLKITGTDLAIASATEQVQSTLAAHKEETRKKTAHSTILQGKKINGSEGVKAIIGKGGQTIQSIQNETECKLDADVERGCVTITGPSEEQVSQAATLCKHAVFGESQHVIELKSVSRVMLVYGKEYQKIREIQDTSGAKLDIAKGTTTLKLSGPNEAVAEARLLVESWLAYCEGEVLRFEANQVGAVYGKGGETIRRIQDRTGAFVEINDKGKKGSDIVVCNIMGDPDAVKEAKGMVLKAIEGEIELKAGEVMEKLELDVGAPAVIGRGGSKIRELEKLFGVRLVVKSGTGLCRIVGRKDDVEKAKKEIITIVEPFLEEKRIKEEADRLAEQAATTSDTGAWGGTVDDGDGW
mmetsp:Transcript_14816/g.22781  ORF Transcript_14816/g.22781 Transcript_14816/m.22781 type:complete len:580 (-) Transcript_14816:246-1985(-)